jgi:hypothetical protein
MAPERRNQKKKGILGRWGLRRFSLWEHMF